MSGEFGVSEAIAMALGGMIGGGIYAVFGVVARLTGPATWAAFVLAGAVATCAAYSFNALNSIVDDSGGSVTFVQAFVGNHTAAGMVGWTLLFGYVGSMAMYASAFAEFTVGFAVVPGSLAGLSLRPVVAVLAVAGFVGLNLLGAQATGTTEVVLVAAKVAILLAFGVVGLVFLGVWEPQPVKTGVAELAGTGPVMAAAVSFVAFQGWQLLFYDQDSIEDPVSTVRESVYVSIPVAVLVYVLVAVVTVNVAPQALQQRPHVALAKAAERMLGPVGLSAVGYVVISLSALLSTGSAINATLFSSAHFAKGLLSEDLLPDRIGDGDADGVPTRTVLVLGAVTAAFAASGGLGAVTSFASLAFIAVFGVVSAIAFSERDRDAVNPIPPALGLVGAASFLPLLFYHLFWAERPTFWLVLVLAVVVLGLELLYFERDLVEEEAEMVESLV